MRQKKIRKFPTNYIKTQDVVNVSRNNSKNLFANSVGSL